MANRNRVLFAAVAGVLFATLARAQDWGVGAAVGLAADVERHFRLDEFERHDGQAWVDYSLEDRVLLRATAGSLKVKGDRAGTTGTVGTSQVLLPDLTSRIDYVTLGVSYEFVEGDYTSGLFGGIGGYRVDPDPVASELRSFRDPKETVWGFHLGVDGDLRVLARLSIVGRLTYHNVRSATRRSIVTASAGAVYRF